MDRVAGACGSVHPNDIELAPRSECPQTQRRARYKTAARFDHGAGLQPLSLTPGGSMEFEIWWLLAFTVVMTVLRGVYKLALAFIERGVPRVLPPELGQR